MQYTKDFESWFKVKQSIQERSDTPPGYKEREVWWAQLGLNVGDEEDGKGEYFSRPILIVKGFSKCLVWAVPLTSNPKVGRFYHSALLDGKTSTVILSQLRTLDIRRFTNRIGVLDEQTFHDIKHKLVALFL